MDDFKNTDAIIEEKNKFRKKVDDSKNGYKEKFKLKNLLQGKNLAIVILSFLLICFSLTIPSDNTEQLQNSIEELNTKITNQEQQLKDNEEKIKALQNDNEGLNQQIKTLNAEKDELKKENDSIIASFNTYTPTSSNLSIPTATNNSSTENNNIEQMVWVGNTGNKYHKQNCSTLKGNGHQITYQQAIAEGRQACKVCKP